jgi:5-methylcytosine-specific restriction endonuclease McrA
MTRVLVLNASDELLGVTHLARAVNLVLDERADVVASSGRILRSPRLELVTPDVIRLRRYVHVPYKRAGQQPTLVALTARDGRNCAYCVKHPATTIDHVLPRSRGGAHTWENTVAACSRCNNKKGARTPHEAGMALAITPRQPVSAVWLAIVAGTWNPVWEPFVTTLGLTAAAF